MKKILIVDDAELNREILKDIFEPYFQVIEAENGRQAVEIIHREYRSLALVLLDLVMPVMNGLEVLDFLKQQGILDYFPVIMITGESSGESDELAYGYGVADIIYKPFSRKIVSRRAMNVIELYEKRFLAERKLKESTLKIEDYERFITEMIRYASSEGSPDEILNQIMQYIGSQFNCDRAFIVEENEQHTFDNTYEWCKSGVASMKIVLKGVPFEGVFDNWYREFMNSRNITIFDIEEYRKVSEPIYKLLHPYDVRSVVVEPIISEGHMIGFYGVDNPPLELISNISNILDMMEFVISMMIRLRNYSRSLEERAVTDQLTGCKNRKALDWAYQEQFDHNMPFAAIMCDLNGLKQVNDNEGHASGDRFICSVSGILVDVFGMENVYRIGGDEFAVTLTGLDEAETKSKYEACRERLGNRAALGMVYYDQLRESFEEVLKEADGLMYEAKKIMKAQR